MPIQIPTPHVFLMADIWEMNSFFWKVHGIVNTSGLLPTYAENMRVRHP